MKNLGGSALVLPVMRAAYAPDLLNLEDDPLPPVVSVTSGLLASPRRQLMTPESAMVPFLVRRSEPMAAPVRNRIRYDPLRQITEVEVDGRWVDAPDHPNDLEAGTQVTNVRVETTDDS